MRRNLFIAFLFLFCESKAQQGNFVSKAWVSDNGNGTYTNPVINADYSDPDAVRVGDDYYLVSSSFNHVPGLPILHSRDLVNWTVIAHALPRQTPFDHFSQVQHGNGVWAPAIRHHQGEFYIYYPDPDFGIYVIRAKNIRGPWTDPVLVEGGKGLIDPCPLWDDNGKVYLVHAYAGSRAGFKSIIVVKQMNVAGTKTIDNGVMVYDGHDTDPTIEGPKFYKRNGWYYIFAPAGGVSTGWQLVLRSKNIYGPYERKVVMDQGTSTVNGPHQGAWVNTPGGENWFLHFQDKEAYGRVVHLQPMKWVNDWPVIGIDKDGDGKGEPIMTYKKPGVTGKFPVITPQDSEEFNSSTLGLQWQWQANPQPSWAFPTSSGSLRMFSVETADTLKNYWYLPNILGQKLPAEEFRATVKLNFRPRWDNEKVGFILLGADYGVIALQKKTDGIYLTYSECIAADKGRKETEKSSLKLTTGDIYLQIVMNQGAKGSFNFSTDGKNFTTIGGPFTAKPGRWVGAKIGLFCTRINKTNDAGYVEVDWIRFEK
ncbi:MAG: glycoside hydrolase 43 family protein [Chitinophagaceae bacterium]|nr:glycoside hydrolase 43 family protein [Chitinophagaceae bacterium]